MAIDRLSFFVFAFAAFSISTVMNLMAYGVFLTAENESMDAFGRVSLARTQPKLLELMTSLIIAGIPLFVIGWLVGRLGLRGWK